MDVALLFGFFQRGAAFLLCSVFVIMVLKGPKAAHLSSWGECSHRAGSRYIRCRSPLPDTSWIVFLPRQKARGCYTATHCTGPDDVTSSRKHIHSARPGNHMSITIHFVEQCGRVQIKGAFCLTSRSCLLGDESTCLMSRPAHSFLGSPHIRNSCNLESWLSGQVEATAQKEPN